MGMAAVGVMPREIRLVIISLGIVLDRRRASASSAIEFALGVILVGAVITVIQRILSRPPPRSAAVTNPAK